MGDGGNSADDGKTAADDGVASGDEGSGLGGDTLTPDGGGLRPGDGGLSSPNFKGLRKLCHFGANTSPKIRERLAQLAESARRLRTEP